MADAFERLAIELDSPAAGAADITPHATDDLPDGVCRAIYVGGAGNIALVMANGDEVTFNGATAGTVLPLRVKAVRDTGTTATNLVALY